MRDAKRYPPDMAAREQRFEQQCRAGLAKAQYYEDAALQTLALETIPLMDINERALARLEGLSPEARASVSDVSQLERHCTLLELLAWFKNEFFSWANAFPCNRCPAGSNQTKFSGMGDASAEERADGAGRVELYTCNSCAAQVRFARYDHPRKLLQTRVGRCGEWANCFTLCARSMGFEVRIALDWTDHVWTEVWSELEGRWLHCDACENVCDQPLLYEQGWNKQLTYVIACANDEIQDVTWRYSKDHAATWARRLDARENWLLNFVIRTTEQLPSADGQRRQRRRLADLVNMLLPHKPPAQTLGGRTSGSLAWRLARGECQSGQTAAAASVKTVIKPTDEELANGRLCIDYFCASDEYRRGDQVVKGFGSLLAVNRNCFRKFEPDWQQAYLCRQEGFSGEGVLEWQIDVSGGQLTAIELSVRHKTYENGRILWEVSLGAPPPGYGRLLPHNVDAAGMRISCGEMKLASGFLYSTLYIRALLSGGSGDVAWQHAQLCRTHCTQEADTSTLHFEIKFKRVADGNQKAEP